MKGLISVLQMLMFSQIETVDKYVDNGFCFLFFAFSFCNLLSDFVVLGSGHIIIHTYSMKLRKSQNKYYI